MFATHFFAFMDWKPEYFKYALPADGNPILARMARLAKELHVVLPVNFFERANNAYYNTIMMLDHEGRELGFYRKAHIPMGPPGCFEKGVYHRWRYRIQGVADQIRQPGRRYLLGSMVSRIGSLHVRHGSGLVCSYPTGIGSGCLDHWQTAMQGHAAARYHASHRINRIGREAGEFGETTFWGRSFIAGPTGQIVSKAGADAEEVIVAEFDLEANREMRANWGIFRDRRPDLYWPLMTLDGKTRQGSTPPAP